MTWPTPDLTDEQELRATATKPARLVIRSTPVPDPFRAEAEATVWQTGGA